MTEHVGSYAHIAGRTYYYTAEFLDCLPQSIFRRMNGIVILPPAAVSHFSSHFLCVFESLDRIGSIAAPTRVQELRGDNFDSVVYTGYPDSVSTSGPDCAGYVCAVTVSIVCIPYVLGEILAVDVIDVTVVVVVYTS